MNDITLRDLIFMLYILVLIQFLFIASLLFKTDGAGTAALSLPFIYLSYKGMTAAQEFNNDKR